MTLKALIFDVDGTLAETEEVHRQAFNQAFAEFGLGWDWDVPTYRRLLTVSGGKERMLAYGQGLAGLEELIPGLHRRKTELYTARVAAGEVAFRPGIERLVEDARAAGLRLAVATTTSRANLAALLKGRDWFEFCACAEDAPVKKPDPSVYRLVVERLGLAPADCLALEDSRNGVQAATGAGVPVVVSESVYTAGDDFTGALAVFPDFGRVGLTDLRRLLR